jgi:hypothetical protein
LPNKPRAAACATGSVADCDFKIRSFSGDRSPQSCCSANYVNRCKHKICVAMVVRGQSWELVALPLERASKPFFKVCRPERSHSDPGDRLRAKSRNSGSAAPGPAARSVAVGMPETIRPAQRRAPTPIPRTERPFRAFLSPRVESLPCSRRAMFYDGALGRRRGLDRRAPRRQHFACKDALFLTKIRHALGKLQNDPGTI